MTRILIVAAGALALFLAVVLAWLNFTPQGRLIGGSYLTPPSYDADVTAQSAASDLSVLNVDFTDGASALDALTALVPELHRTAEVSGDWLRLRGVPERAGWYSDRSGPLYFQHVTGDFLVETRARSVLAADGVSRPRGSFNSAGLVVRDPSSDQRDMRWVMYNLGQQAGFYGTEAKTTVPDTGEWHMQSLAGFHSKSTLWLTPLPDDVVEAGLRICRIGDEFRFFKRLPGSGAWVEEADQAGTVVQGNGAHLTTPGVIDGGVIRFIRNDLPQTVQVGLITNPGMPPNDGESRFDGLRFERIDDFAACLSA